MRHNFFKVLLLLLVVTLVGACMGSSDDDRTHGGLTWRDCGDGLQCATLDAPVDRLDPDGPTVSVAIQRFPARDAGRRIGPLFVNTGGPLPVLPHFRSVAAGFPSELRDVFDIVAFDPRGLGRSDAIDCGFDVNDLFANVDYSPDSESEFDRVLAVSTSFAEACAASESSDLLGHIDIRSIATDMDDIRAAMGDDQLSYLGFSWGTYLGAVYAEHFPERVRAMVLDGVVDPAAHPRDAIASQALGFEASLNEFFEWCDDNSRGCTYHPEDPHGAFIELMERIDAQPIAAGGHDVGPSEFDLAVASLLYLGRDGYPNLAAALGAAERGDATQLHQLYQEYIASDGSAESYQGFLAFACGDVPLGMTVDELRAFSSELGAQAEVFGSSTALMMLPCTVWPVQGSTVAEPLRASGAPPILVVGTTGDPATPYEQAVAVAEALDSAVLVTYEGERHTAYGVSTCVNAIVDAYLLELTVPASDTRC